MKEYISEGRIRLMVDSWAEAIRAFQRAARRIRSDPANDAGRRVARLLEHLEHDQPQHRRLPIRSRGKVYFLDIADIDWLEAADNYVKVHADRKTHVVRKTLQRLEDVLAPRGFIRVHRSVLVNIARIEEIQSWFGGEYVVRLRDGTRVTSSRRYRSRLQALMD